MSAKRIYFPFTYPGTRGQLGRLTSDVTWDLYTPLSDRGMFHGGGQTKVCCNSYTHVYTTQGDLVVKQTKKTKE